MNNELAEKLNILISNIDNIEEYIERSNYPLMEQCVQVFLMNYSKTLMDIITYLGTNNTGIDITYWTNITPRIIAATKSGDVFEVMNTMYFDLRENVKRLKDICSE